MPTQLTLVDVWNGAIDHISDKVINDPMEDTVYTRWLKRNYPNLLDAELRANPWNFAMTYHELTPTPTPPLFRWASKYQLPVGAIRFLPPTEGGVREAPTVLHEIVGDELYTNLTGKQFVRCISRITEPGRWDPMFAEMLMASLAMKMCTKFTGKMDYLVKVQAIYTNLKKEAIYTDAIEGSGEPVEQHEVISVRYA
jgi:hypothetical protein